MNNTFMPWRSPAAAVFVLILAVIIAGCGNVIPSGPVVPAPDPGTEPGTDPGTDPATDPPRQREWRRGHRRSGPDR